ncbi:MAG: hypothetical protein A2Z72_05460 [Omnitrophica bacterium RBG_13_46_9]|nr:MAG: hypothetical protein A2Z72_05460 [Omnitrophica bacterium RBG_13_46_9]
MRVLLIDPPRSTKALGLGEDKLGLLYMAAILREKNIDVRVYDAHIENNPFKDLKSLLKKYKPTIVGISIYTPTRFDAFKAAKLVKHADKETLVVAGGPHVSSAPRDTLENIKEIDIIVVGEGERVFLEICNSVAEKKSFEGIKSIALRKEGDILINARCEPIKNLDSLPFPARDLLRKYKHKEKSKYHFNMQMPDREIIKLSSTCIITARGCPFNCLFCAVPELWGRNVRLRSPENVISEIKHLKEAFDVDSFQIVDDTFNISRKRVFDICSVILKERLKVKWHCHMRVDNVDREMLVIMKEAGCFITYIGIESGSQKILDQVIGKKITLDKVRKVIGWCDELGIKRSCNFIYSLPGETREDVAQTIALMKELGGKQPFGPTMILPGSRIEKIAKEKGIMPKDFSWSRISPYKYYDPTSNSFLPIFVENLTWNEILDIFYKHITWQSTMRTKNYIFRILYRLLQIRSFTEAKLIFYNYFNFLRVFFRNLKKQKRKGAKTFKK